MAAEVHRYKVGDIEVTVLTDGFRMVPVDGNYLSNASADDLAEGARGGGPADRQDEEHLFADRADDGRQARAVRHRQRRGGGGAEQERARHAQRQSRGGRHRPQRDRRGGDLAFPRRPCERPADARQQPGVSERRDQGAGERVEVLDGRRRDEPRLEGPHDRAVRQQPPGVRRARPQGHALRLGQGGRSRRDRGRHARPQHRAHVVRRRRPAARRCSCSPTSATTSRCSRRIRTGTASSTRTRRRPPPRAAGSTTCWWPRSCRCRAITFRSRRSLASRSRATAIVSWG